MATVTDPGVDAVSTSNVTSYGNAEFAPDLAFTPAVNDLIVVAVATSGSVEPTAAGAITDDQGGTYTEAIFSVRTGSASSNYIFVRDQAVTSAVLHTLTFTCTGDAATGAAAVPLRVSGMTRYGASAVKQTAKTDNGSAGATPAATFGAAVLTGNVTVGMVGSSTNPVTVTEPTSWTERADTGYATPASGIEVVSRDSGFTGTTVTWGSTTVGTYGVCIVELDTSAANITAVLSPGALTFTGQAVATVFTAALTPGVLTIAGQTLTTSTYTPSGAPSFKVGISAVGGTSVLAGSDAPPSGNITAVLTPGALTLTGQTINASRTTPVTPGVLTFAGQTLNSVRLTPLTPGVLTFAGQTVNASRTTPVTPGALTFSGQTLNTSISSIAVLSPGALTFAGQTVNTAVAVTLSPGAITFSGQTLNTSVAVIATLTPGALTITGQALNVTWTTQLTPGAVVLTGQTLTTSIAVISTLTPGAVTFTGQTLNVVRNATVTPGVLTFAGQTLGASVQRFATVTPGALTLAGQNLAITQLLVATVTPGSLVFTGQTLTTINTGAIPPTIITHEGPKAGGLPAGSILIVAHEGAQSGGSPAGAVLTLEREGQKAGGAAAGSVLTQERSGAKAGGVAAGNVLRVSRKGP